MTSGVGSFFSRKNSKIQTTSKKTKMLVWNAAGLSSNNTKTKWDFICGYSVLLLSKTWITEDKEKLLQSRLSKFHLAISPARKNKTKGRAKGGLFFGIDKKLTTKIVILHCSEEMLAVKVKLIADEREKVFIVTYMNEDKPENWKIIQKIMEEEGYLACIVGGDFNARIGVEDYRDEQEMKQTDDNPRQSRDSTLNDDGKTLLSQTNLLGLHILNRIIDGDEEGEYTYIGPRGKFVIDYVLINDLALTEVVHMLITGNIESDHLPLVVTLSSTTCSEEEEHRKIISWSKEKYLNTGKD